MGSVRPWADAAMDATPSEEVLDASGDAVRDASGAARPTSVEALSVTVACAGIRAASSSPASSKQRAADVGETPPPPSASRLLPRSPPLPSPPPSQLLSPLLLSPLLPTPQLFWSSLVEDASDGAGLGTAE
mmetsp:Transcript_30955/g.80899  ORF Transcript_30955/g.80899 Transcript_30955/m.80899 type:complete len:131 (-) Transcript_30955:1814-2206(-)